MLDRFRWWPMCVWHTRESKVFMCLLRSSTTPQEFISSCTCYGNSAICMRTFINNSENSACALSSTSSAVGSAQSLGGEVTSSMTVPLQLDMDRCRGMVLGANGTIPAPGATPAMTSDSRAQAIPAWEGGNCRATIIRLNHGK